MKFSVLKFLFPPTKANRPAQSSIVLRNQCSKKDNSCDKQKSDKKCEKPTEGKASTCKCEKCACEKCECNKKDEKGDIKCQDTNKDRACGSSSKKEKTTCDNANKEVKKEDCNVKCEEKKKEECSNVKPEDGKKKEICEEKTVDPKLPADVLNVDKLPDLKTSTLASAFRQVDQSEDLTRGGCYKNPEHYSFHKYSFYDVISHLDGSRLPQPKPQQKQETGDQKSSPK